MVFSLSSPPPPYIHKSKSHLLNYINFDSYLLLLCKRFSFFSMDFVFLLVFLVLPPVLGLNTSTASTCPQKFICLNPFYFHPPFNYTNNSLQSHSCGLCMTICNKFSLPKIKLDFMSIQWFDVVEEFKNNVIKLRDLELQSLLHNQDCNSFNHNMSIPKEYDGALLGNESCIPRGCSTIQLPVRPLNEVSYDSNLFDLLTADFELEWHTRDSCTRLCQKEGEISDLSCPKNETKNSGEKSLEVIIGTCVAGGAFLTFLAMVLIFYKKRKRKGISILPRESSGPSSKPDLEGGSAVYFGLPVFSYSELEEVTNNFDISKELGSGGFGTVYYGKLHDGREVAVKRLYEHNFRRMAQFLNEVEILTRLRHPNLVSLYGCTSRRSRELLLVYEYIPNGTVDDHLHGDREKYKSLTWALRMNIAIETATALAYLHASDIIHRDVKTNNILLDHNFQVKVADFGLSRLFPNDVSHISTAPQGTPGYVDPEYHQCYQLTDKSDVYSFGVVLIELISSMPAVDIRRHSDEINLAKLAINRIQRNAYIELIDLSLGYESEPAVMKMTVSVADLAFRCLQPEKELRPSMDEVLETLKQIQDCK